MSVPTDNAEANLYVNFLDLSWNSTFMNWKPTKDLFTLDIDELQSRYANWRFDDGYIYLFVKVCKLMIWNESWKLEQYIAQFQNYYFVPLFFECILHMN